MDIDAAGGVATAGLVGAAIERPTGEAGEEHVTCTDCGAPAGGRFCANCGQPTHIHRSLLHLGEEMLHGVLHFDARIWRTLPLLAVNPGRLTREWVQGRRTRYVSPLAIFLFTIFMMFFVLSFTGGLEPRVTSTGPQEGAATGASGGYREDGLRPGSWQARVRDSVESGNTTINVGHAGLNKTMTKKLLNPDLALYKLQQTTYKFSFLLIPLSIPFVALLFLWRRGFTLYDHGVFVLYSLTAMSILFMVVGVLAPLWRGFAILGGIAFVVGVPVHIFAQLKGAYDLSWYSAAWRTALLLMFCGLILMLFIVSITILGLTG